MLDLYLLRHGIAADATATGDAARPLTAEGITKMEAAANGMLKLGIDIGLILSSPLVRAHETAAIVARTLRVPLRITPALAPGCDISRLEEALMLAPAGTAVMVVGHEPDLSELIEILSGARVVMRKGGLARLTLMSLSARYATLTWLLPAKILRAAG